MALPDRIANALTSRSRAVILVLLMLTALVGAGMPMLEEDTSLEQFESDSTEREALDDINDRFVAEGDENTTSVQVIARDDDVLTRESLLDSLELQQEIHATESIGGTLVEDDPITGVENVVAITAITEEQVSQLEARGAELEQREAQLENRTATLDAGLEDALALQREQAQLRAAGDEAGAAEIESEIDAAIAETVAAADLDDEQANEYEERVGQARAIESDRWAIEQQTDAPGDDPAYQELTESLESVSTGATLGVLESEYERLEADFEAFEEDQRQLEADDERPSLDEQIDALEDLSDEEFEAVLRETLSADADGDGGTALAFMPTDYEPGSTEADARVTLVTQQTDGGTLSAADEDARIDEAQLELRELATGADQEYVVFGAGIITDEIDRSMDDSLAIVGPFALLFVIVALTIAYRDPLDVALGVVGIIGVLIWTFGFMGWAGIAFNQMMIAVPVLLIGLSIDYAIHVFMRHREQRETEGVTSTVRGSMSIALAGVGVALVWVTATTAIGFLANLVSPIRPIQEFGVVSAVGILSALIVFGGLIPALKVEIDSVLESRGWSRRKRAVGTGDGGFATVLSGGATAARTAPAVVLIVALLLTAGGVYGATQVDTSFDEEDFLAESPPSWTEHLPGVMTPGEYQAADDLEYVNENFHRPDSQAQLFVEGNITDPDAVQRLSDAEREAGESDVVYLDPTGEPDVQGPLSVMESVAAQNESFNETYQASLNDDGVPAQNIAQLYDELFEADESAASSVIYRTDDGEYESARLVVAIHGTAGFDDAADEMQTIAGSIDVDGAGDQRTVDVDDGEVHAIATGNPIINHTVEQDLLDTVLESLLITLVTVFAFLTVAYWLTGTSATLGAVTLLPVAFTVSWILGTMSLLGMPFNVLTGMITSLTIGLGVAYSIHISSRYMLELERQGTVADAMRTTVTGTGGALLGSAVTTVGGFGTLALAFMPVLRQFGIITGLTIAYAFLASVVVLPSLLVLWTRYVGPDVPLDATDAADEPEARSETDDEPEARSETDDEPEAREKVTDDEPTERSEATEVEVPAGSEGDSRDR
ncbi:efflux RND transporter permease subunit [Natronolimnohabitans innermongolicus]|uniref:SSD domain-containing protein n=1 Tax=Natronolimnohabitans innermongolicus JCM 12255 TaxID=1227499 RepID=L9XKP6_9EURY|nr:MMPL family transporter [Natronolimnohabitans innermongolicus]ELY61203.1 hypothetical protein C493_02778 [Natronolimnohabitans innermongolicus JCM 12255]